MILTHSDQCVISTHALTEGDPADGFPQLIQVISTHALTEGDFSLTFDVDRDKIFQLTPSRRATEVELYWIRNLEISTHALTEGDDLSKLNIRINYRFQLTPSRRATANLDKFFF